MNYLDFDLGSCSAGSTVLVELTGVESDVILLSSVDVNRFKARQRVTYFGGHTNKSPVRLGVPSDGHWHVIIVPGPGGTVRAKAQVLRAA